MSPAAFAISLFVLLAVPGPTNALLLALGAVGPKRALAAPLAALAGYLLAVLALGLVLGPVIAAQPVISTLLRLAAGAYLLISALRLWRAEGLGAGAGAPPLGAVFVTTLLNPKAIIIALVLMPEGWTASPALALPALAIVSGQILIVSTLWLGLGVALRQMLARLGHERAPTRLCALVLGLFGAALMAASLAR